MLIAAVGTATILAFAAYLIAGRWIGLSITAFCGAMMAFFVMPPVFSFRISRTHDLVALAVYGAAGLLLSKTAPERRRRAAIRVDWPAPPESSGRQWTELSAAIESLLSSRGNMPFRNLDLSLPQDAFLIPCTRDQAVQILSDVLSAALQVPIACVSIYGAQRPGMHRLTVAAHLVYPTPLRSVVTVGLRDEDCEAVKFPGWLPNWHATRFDNGCDRIFQISIGTDGLRPLSLEFPSTSAEEA